MGEDSMSEPDFVNRTVLVTGGSRGIGRACCERLARAGAQIAINFRSREDDALETARLVEAAGARAMIVQADVADEASVERMVAHVNDRLGPIDMLVNNAGIFEYVTPEAMTLEHWRRTVDVNLTGLYIVTWAVKDQMAAAAVRANRQHVLDFRPAVSAVRDRLLRE